MQKTTLLSLIITFSLTFITGNTYAQGKFKRLDTQAFYQKIINSDDALIIDVRLGYDFARNRIQNASLAETKKDLTKLVKTIPKKAPIMLYCQDGDRSKQAANFLKKKGFKHVFDLKNGLVSWIEKGLPLDTVKLD